MTLIKSRLSKLERMRVGQTPENYLQLHRNTRPEEHSQYEKQIFIDSIKSSNFHQYPDISRLHEALADFVSVDEKQIQITSITKGYNTRH